MDKLVFKGQNDQILTNSLLVAEKFGKEHQHVLRDVRSLIDGVSNLGDTPMFVETTYINEQNGQEYPMFVMNRDGFTLLVMGYTGKKALRFKLDYIAAFNAMEKQLKEQQGQSRSPPHRCSPCKPTSTSNTRIASARWNSGSMPSNKSGKRTASGCWMLPYPMRHS